MCDGASIPVYNLVTLRRVQCCGSNQFLTVYFFLISKHREFDRVDQLDTTLLSLLDKLLFEALITFLSSFTKV